MFFSRWIKRKKEDPRRITKDKECAKKNKVKKEYSKEDEEEVKKRLKSLGYM